MEAGFGGFDCFGRFDVAFDVVGADSDSGGLDSDLDTEISDSGVGILDVSFSGSAEVSFVIDGAADGVRDRFGFRSDLRVRFGFLADLSSSDFSGLASMNSRILSRSSLPR